MSESDTAREAAPAEPAPPPAPPRPFAVRSFGVTDPGRVRPSNEDHFAVVELARTMNIHHTSLPQPKAQSSSHRGHILIVADGMGGHRAGEVASAVCVESVEGFLLNTLKRFFRLDHDERDVLGEFRTALLRADARVFEEVARHPEMAGMGTTLTMAFAADWRLFVAHAGDSRGYLYSGRHLHRLTQDHTVVAELVRHGELSPQQAARHPHRHVVTNALGGHRPGVLVELHELALEPGDVLLLCTDGLTEMVPDDRIAAVLGEAVDPQRACEQLVAEANANGGKDNVTAVVAEFSAS